MIETPEVRLDFDREKRKGIGEVIYCPGKSDKQLVAIADSVVRLGINMAFSRMTKEQAQLLQNIAGFSHDPVSRLGVIRVKDVEERGSVAVLTAGSSDIPVAEEAAGMAEFCGCRVERYYDVGVAGLHRLLDVMPSVRQADVIIVAAGMDGALPSVVSGLAPCLVIGLPTSVGYGVASGGRVALDTMLSSCSPGLVTVNIDNGIGAALAAAMVVKGRGQA